MKPRRRSSTTKSRKLATPAQIRAYIEDLYTARQAEWHARLMKEDAVDWGCLLGLHLQMSELERLNAGLEEEMLG